MEKKLSYSQAVEEIQDIIMRIEEEQLDMDELSKATKRALELIKFCKLKLRSTEEDIEKMLDELSGNLS
ncbi:MAG: exodeoxyribonuclease VII small subunit [Bacteroidales bacterium]